MDELISRQAAVDALEDAEDAFGYLTKDWREVLEQLPPIQPKRGRWIGKYPVSSICSECGYLINDSKVKVFAFCPNCGADMREVNHESN